MTITRKERRARELRQRAKRQFEQPAWIDLTDDDREALSEWLSPEQLADLEEALKDVSIERYEDDTSLPAAELRARLTEMSDKARELRELVEAHYHDLGAIMHRGTFPEWALTLQDDSVLLLGRLEASTRALSRETKTRRGSPEGAPLRMLADVGLRRFERSGETVSDYEDGRAAHFLRALFAAAGYEITHVRRHLKRYKRQQE